MWRSSFLAIALVLWELIAFRVAAQTAPTTSSSIVQKTTLTVSVSGLRKEMHHPLISNLEHAFRPSDDNLGQN